MDLSPVKILVLGLVAMIVLGPERLPQAARTAGRMMAEVRRLSAGVQDEVASAITEPRDVLAKSAEQFDLSDIPAKVFGSRNSLRGALADIVKGAAGPGPPIGVAVEKPQVAVGPGVPVSPTPSMTLPEDPSQADTPSVGSPRVGWGCLRVGR